jgi:hypothetical protein
MLSRTSDVAQRKTVEESEGPAKVIIPLVVAHTIAAFCGLLISSLFGLVVSIDLQATEFLFARG